MSRKAVPKKIRITKQKKWKKKSIKEKQRTAERKKKTQKLS